MLHFGDITKIDGHKVPIVDVVIGGSPCQDLSVAGKREGMKKKCPNCDFEAEGKEKLDLCPECGTPLEYTRSGLFMEQIRIIKEMRENDKTNGRTNEFIRPRYMVWENVPGAFSSNQGEDFRAVLEETAKIADEKATIPRPKNNKWSSSGVIMGRGWSIAWRVHDAQFWGVPQRRKRIALVADFGGESAPEILFERESVSGNTEQSKQKREETPRTVGDCSDASSWTLKIRGGVDVDSNGKKAGKGALVQTELSGTLGVSQDQTLIQKDGKCLNPWDVQSKHVQPENGIAEALYSGECRGGGGESYVMQSSDGDIAGTLDASYYKGCGVRQDRERTVVYGISAYESNSMKSPNPNSGIYEADTTRTLDNNGGNPACNQGGMIVLEGNGSRPSHKGDGYAESDVSYTLNAVEQHAVCVGNGQLAQARLQDKVGTLNCMHDQQAILTYGVDCYNQTVSEEKTMPIRNKNADSDHVPCVTYGLDRASFNQGKNAKYDFSVQEEIAQPIVARGPGGVLTKQSEPCVQEITKE